MTPSPPATPTPPPEEYAREIDYGFGPSSAEYEYAGEEGVVLNVDGECGDDIPVGERQQIVRFAEEVVEAGISCDQVR